MAETKTNGNNPIRLAINNSGTNRPRSRSFFLVDSRSYRPRFSEDAPTVVFSGDHDIGKVSPTDEKGTGDEGLRSPQTRWVNIRSIYKDFFSEFWGVFIIILFGDAAVAQVLTSGGAKGEFYSIPWAWAIGVMLGAYVSRRSGAHMNPAVTLAFCIFRKFSWRKLPIYALAQVLGALVASAVVYGNYISAIDNFEGYNVRTVPGAGGNDSLATAGIFNTYPAPFMIPIGMFFSEVLASATLLFCVFALLDEGNIGAGPFLPIGLFFIIFGIGTSLGWETGFAINPARDFGPRLMSYMIGYGPSVWTVGTYYFWIPVIAPCVGAVTGAFLYDLFLFEGDSPINKPWFGLRSERTEADKPERSPV